MGTLKSSTKAKRRGSKLAFLGRDTRSAVVAPEDTISSASTGDVVGPATTRELVNKAWARSRHRSLLPLLLCTLSQRLLLPELIVSTASFSSASMAPKRATAAQKGKAKLQTGVSTAAA